MATISTIAGGDGISPSRTVINTNFSNLNADKIETSVIDVDTTLAANSDAKIPSQKAVKAFVEAGGNVSASTTAKGIVQEATQAQANNQTAVGSTGARLFVNPAAMPLPFALSTPSTGATILRYSDRVACVSSNAASNTIINVPGAITKTVDVTSFLAGADTVESAVILGSYLYLLVTENSAAPDTKAVYRVNLSDLSTNSVMSFSGAVVLVNSNSTIEMTSDGTFFYFSFQGGNSANSYVIAKYSLSDTTFTYVSSTTLGATSISEFAVKSDGTFLAHDLAGTTSLYKYSSAGTLTDTYTSFFSGSGEKLFNLNETYYVWRASLGNGTQIVVP